MRARHSRVPNEEIVQEKRAEKRTFDRTAVYAARDAYLEQFSKIKSDFHHSRISPFTTVAGTEKFIKRSQDTVDVLKLNHLERTYKNTVNAHLQRIKIEDKATADEFNKELAEIIVETINKKYTNILIPKLEEWKLSKAFSRGVKFGTDLIAERPVVAVGALTVAAATIAAAYPVWAATLAVTGASGIKLRRELTKFFENEKARIMKNHKLTTEEATEQIANYERWKNRISFYVTMAVGGVTRGLIIPHLLSAGTVAHKTLEHAIAQLPHLGAKEVVVVATTAAPVEHVVPNIPEIPALTELPKIRGEIRQSARWAENFVEEWRRVAGTDAVAFAELKKFEAAAHTIQEINADLERGVKSNTAQMIIKYNRLIDAGSKPEFLNTPGKMSILESGSKLHDFSPAMKVLLGGYEKLASIQNGEVLVKGEVVSIDTLNDGKFLKYEGQADAVDRNIARAMIEYQKLLGENIRVTEAGTELTSQHSLGGGHQDGTAFDFTPADRKFDNETVYKALKVGYDHDDDYKIHLEPGDLPAGELKAYVASRFAQDYEMNYEDALRYAEKHIKNNSNTTGTHFHVQVRTQLASAVTPPNFSGPRAFDQASN